MASLIRRILTVAMVVTTLLLFAYISLLLTVNSAMFQEWAKKEIANRSGYDISARDIRLDPLLRLTLMEVTASRAAGVALQADRIVIVPGAATLFSRTIPRIQLERPVLNFDIYQFFESTKQEPLAVRVRQLIIADGTLVLRSGEGSEVDFRDLAMTVENFNLGEGIGVQMRTHVPWLDGTASITIQHSGVATEAVIRVEQNGDVGQLVRGKSRLTLDSDIKLTSFTDGPIRVSVKGKLNAMRFAGETFSGEISGSAEIEPELKAAAFAATAVASELPAKWLGVRAPVSKAGYTVSVRGSYESAGKTLSFESVELTSPLGKANGKGQINFVTAAAWQNVSVRLRNIAVENLKRMLPAQMHKMVVGGEVEADLEVHGPWRDPVVEGIARVSNSKLQHEQFSLAEVKIEAPLRWTGNSLRAADLRLSARKLIVQDNKQIAISAEAVQIAGTLEKKLDAALTMGGTVRIEQGAFATVDGSKIGEKLSVQAHIDSLRIDGGVDVFVAGKINVAKGEILWGKFYGNLESQRPTLNFEAEYRWNNDLLRLRRADLALASVGEVAFHGEFEKLTKNPTLRLAIRSNAVNNSGFFDFFIRETLNRSYPILDKLAVGGHLSLTANASGPFGEPTVEGQITLRRGELRAKSNDWHLAGIAIALPFKLSYPAALSMATPIDIAAGTLTIESAKFGTEFIGEVKSTLSLRNNFLRFHDPIRLRIYGGLLEIKNLAWKDIIETPKAVSLSLEAKNLQLRKLTESLGWYRFGGTLSGSIPKIEWTGNSLRSQGQIDVALFGGLLRMNGLEIQAPFSSVPAVRIDARFQDIQLEQASETFAFGRISGVLEGTVNDLAITEGQPSTFSADISSVEKSGVSQRISVESLNKITVLSSGQDAGALYGGIAGFFDSFRYSKLGFKATLKNDRLTLRGVESRGGQEYLVVGSFLPPTVNVVSHTQEISFSELVRRLERIQKSEKVKKMDQ